MLIAHRLSTVGHAELVIFMDQARTIVSHTFEQIRQAFPDFDHPAKSMGLGMPQDTLKPSIRTLPLPIP